MAITVNINGNIQVGDTSTGTTALQKLLTGLSTSGNTFSENNVFAVVNSPTSVTLPVSPLKFLYIKNIDPTATIQVTWTPNGGAINVVLTLEAGSAIMFIEAAAGAGITALSLESSATSSNVEMILAG